LNKNQSIKQKLRLNKSVCLQENLKNQIQEFLKQKLVCLEEVKKRKLCLYQKPFVNKMWEALILIILKPSIIWVTLLRNQNKQIYSKTNKMYLQKVFYKLLKNLNIHKQYYQFLKYKHRKVPF
jgi:hypothetical protein